MRRLLGMGIASKIGLLALLAAVVFLIPIAWSAR